MATVRRHPVDTEQARARLAARRGAFLDGLRQLRESSGNVGSLALDGLACCEYGAVLGPEDPSIRTIARATARAFSACLLLKWRGPNPLRYRIDDSDAVTLTTVPSVYYAHAGNLEVAWHLAALTRQPDLFEDLRSIPLGDLKRDFEAATGGAAATVDLYLDGWQDGRFSGHPDFRSLESIVASADSRTPAGRYQRQILGPYLDVLRALEDRDDRGFGDALTAALERHTQYYKATKKRRDDPAGFFPLRLAAVTGAAWDRGMRFDVQTDYFPYSWMTGEAFSRS